MNIPLLNQRGYRVTGACLVVVFSGLMLLGFVLDADTRHGAQVGAVFCFVLAGWFAAWGFDCFLGAAIMDRQEDADAERNEYAARWVPDSQPVTGKPHRCYRCRKMIAGLAEVTGITLAIREGCLEDNKTIRRCLSCDESIGNAPSDQQLCGSCLHQFNKTPPMSGGDWCSRCGDPINHNDPHTECDQCRAGPVDEDV